MANGNVQNAKISSYEGENTRLILEYQPHGRGTMNYSNSEIYEGSWNDGNYHGTGELIYENLGSMHGQWQQGVLADDSASKVMQSSPSGEYTG